MFCLQGEGPASGKIFSQDGKKQNEKKNVEMKLIIRLFKENWWLGVIHCGIQYMYIYCALCFVGFLFFLFVSFLFAQQNHMLWYLKRTALLRQFFWDSTIYSMK